jgi:hypothetical protein
VLKTQELQVNGKKLLVREPRLRDYLRAKNGPEEDYTYQLMAGMVLDENGIELGYEGVMELPLTAFDEMNKIVSAMQAGEVAPLAPSDGSSTG